MSDVDKLNEIIVEVPLPPPNKKNWALGPQKIFSEHRIS